MKQLANETSYWEDVHKDYHIENKHIQYSNYKLDLELRRINIPVASPLA